MDQDTAQSVADTFGPSPQDEMRCYKRLRLAIRKMSMFSPPHGVKVTRDVSHTPKGHCRYILLNTEAKGLRCACVKFDLNLSIPGSTCDCGHQACYHVPDKEGPLAERRELDLLKEKVKQLEERLTRDVYSGGQELGERRAFVSSRKSACFTCKVR